MTDEPIVAKVPFTDTANIYLLTNCDMACSFCYASKGLGGFTVQQLRFVLTTLRDHGATHVNLTGGEPLMHPDVLEVAECADTLGFSTTLFTSGSMLTKPIATGIGAHVRWFALSLDGTREKNLEVGRGEGHYEAALRSIEIIREVAPQARVRVTTVATRINVDHLEPLGEVLRHERHRPDLWRIKQMVPTRRGAEMADELGVTTEQFEARMIRLLSALPADFPVQIHGSESKSGDTMCIHPRGGATVTIGDGLDMEILPLGNILSEPGTVFTNWQRRRNRVNASSYNQMWRDPDLFTSSERSRFLTLRAARPQARGPRH
ncbi:radical SAM protein [Frankia sp. Cr1]|uniref:radical SAM protein n=1 Tax=Frankia sp. Cr1 TaxID=3073931 RepID=UPI002AD45BF1|nr:radical SAM protein [Frankia sp. Cr1]